MCELISPVSILSSTMNVTLKCSTLTKRMWENSAPFSNRESIWKFIPFSNNNIMRNYYNALLLDVYYSIPFEFFCKFLAASWVFISGELYCSLPCVHLPVCNFSEKNLKNSFKYKNDYVTHVLLIHFPSTFSILSIFGISQFFCLFHPLISVLTLCFIFL